MNEEKNWGQFTLMTHFHSNRIVNWFIILLFFDNMHFNQVALFSSFKLIEFKVVERGREGERN